MKKTIALVIFLSVLFSVISPVSAAAAKTATLDSIKYTKSGVQDKISINTTDYKGYEVTWLSSPDRLVIDIPNNNVAIKGAQTIKINSQNVINIRFSQFTKTTARVVFDTKGKVPYTVSTAKGSLIFTLGKPADPAKPAAPKPADPVKPAAPVPTPTTVSRGDSERPASVVRRLAFSSSGGHDKLSIPGTDYDGYSIMRLTDPDTIVIDVPSLAVAEDQRLFQADGQYVKAIRTSALDDGGTRIVLDTIGQPDYSVARDASQLIMVLKEPSLANLVYHNSGDRIYVALEKAKLTEVVPIENTDGSLEESAEEGDALKPLYTDSYDKNQIKYSMSFPEGLAKLTPGSLQINDDVLESIDVAKDPDDGVMILTFNAKIRMDYHTLTNPETGVTEISILKPFEAEDKLVVIDAGHGGSDPGAVYAGLNEKDLNLKIALELNDILKDKGVKTYMTRDDDTFVPLKTRAEIANNLNAALFLSIHNNAYNSSEHGTETLYYPGAAGSAFARVVQDTLVSKLGTHDRGIVQRPNLVVLNSTKMPAVIAEVAFLTNNDDRAKLMDDDFLRKSAEALAEAVIKALE